MRPQLGRYRLDEIVGRGASGVVWRAHAAAGLDRTVAIKRGPDLEREAAVLSQLRHPHVVPLLDVVEDDGACALVLAYAVGGSLDDVLRHRGALSEGAATATMRALRDALTAVHAEGVVHGDIRAANVLLGEQGRPWLADFGRATIGTIDNSLADRDALDRLLRVPADDQPTRSFRFANCTSATSPLFTT